MPGFSIELSFHADAGNNARAAHAIAQAVAVARAIPGLVALDCYRPSAGESHDPYVDDGPGPSGLLMLHFDDEKALRAACRTHLGAIETARGVTTTCAVFERRFYDRGGEIAAQPIADSFSYVVRYHRPAEDEAAFVAHYLATHATGLAALPAISHVICYIPLPQPSPPGQLAAANYLIGNEVIFPSRDLFNAAMQSPVRHDLRRHYNAFPKFSGINTHHPMLRERVHIRAAP